jgi:TolB-like protein/predicted Ser/Thr protein kinase
VLEPGLSFLHYRLIEKIGEGGMGVVWRAEDTRLHRQVAMKFVPERTDDDRQSIDRHLREARAASALNNPNICAIYDIGEWEGRRFIVMELLEGRSLQQHIDGRPLDVDAAVALAIQIADALAVAHTRGIVHRDIKPANIVVVESGSTPQAKMLDFGLAKLSSASVSSRETLTRSAPDVTESGRVMGTVPYMSPEQALGKPLDHRTDIFSLGVVLYEMLTGRRAFEGATSAAVFDAILNRAPVAPAELNATVPAALERVVNKALEKDPALRHQSAADLCADLRRVQRDSSTTRPAPTAARPRRRGGLRSVAAVAGVLVVAATMVAVWGSRRGNAPDGGLSSTEAVAVTPGPSIAVLPFVNASGDPEQRYFSDGLTSDIVTELSRYGELSVIACNTKACEGGDADAREIGAALGVRYVLQGRVQRAAERVRVSVQLSNAIDGRSMWGNNYERELTPRDLFGLQDELTQQVVNEIAGSYGALARAELPGARRKPPASLDSYDCVLRVYEYLQQHFAENHLSARDCMERVVDADPDYVDGLAWLAYLYADQFHHRWNEPDGEYVSLDRALEFAERAVRLDDGNHVAHGALALTSFFRGDPQRGKTEAYRAVDLHKSNATWLSLLANYLAQQEDFEHAVPMVQKALELNPNPPIWIRMPLFLDHYFNGRYEEARDLAKEGLIGANDFRGPLYLAAAYGQLGRADLAGPVLADLRVLWTRPMSELRSELIERHAYSPKLADDLMEGLAKSGLEGLNPIRLPSPT